MVRKIDKSVFAIFGFVVLAFSPQAIGRNRISTRVTSRTHENAQRSLAPVASQRDKFSTQRGDFEAIKKINDEQDDDIEKLEQRIEKLEGILKTVITQVNKNAKTLSGAKGKEVITQGSALIDEMRREQTKMTERVKSRKRTRQKAYDEGFYKRSRDPEPEGWSILPTDPQEIHDAAQNFRYAQEVSSALVEGHEIPEPPAKRRRKNPKAEEVEVGPEPEEGEPDHRLEKFEADQAEQAAQDAAKDTVMTPAQPPKEDEPEQTKEPEAEQPKVGPEQEPSVEGVQDLDKLMAGPESSDTPVFVPDDQSSSSKPKQEPDKAEESEVEIITSEWMTQPSGDYPSFEEFVEGKGPLPDDVQERTIVRETRTVDAAEAG